MRKCPNLKIPFRQSQIWAPYLHMHFQSQNQLDRMHLLIEPLAKTQPSMSSSTHQPLQQLRSFRNHFSFLILDYRSYPALSLHKKDYIDLKPPSRQLYPPYPFPHATSSPSPSPSLLITQTQLSQQPRIPSTKPPIPYIFLQLPINVAPPTPLPKKYSLW